MTYVKMRETSNGTEYWNKDLKRTELFAPGTAPENVQTEGMVGQYSASGKVAENENTPPANFIGLTDDEFKEALTKMKIAELKFLAEDNKIDIPEDVTKKDDIINFIFEKWDNAADAQ